MVSAIIQRRQYSTKRLNELNSKISERPNIGRLRSLCIYVTGSYGRGEASERSDVDIFFLHLGSAEKRALSRVNKSLLDASVIEVCRGLGFPEFTGGGQYLDVHYVDDILEQLGSPHDDYKNFFTARMLLLMESKPLANDAVYSKSIEKIVGAYFRDFHDHARDFQPIFLVNDILRYWKTMCLNYEAKRNRRFPQRHAYKKNKVHIKNFKLKFSRMLMCFSFILALLSLGKRVTVPDVIKIVRMTPLERLESVAKKHPAGRAIADRMISEYDWFLGITSKPDAQQELWIASRARRDAAFARANRFGTMLYELLSAVADRKMGLRYLVL